MKTEQNKLEQEFKSKLEERTIQPSNAAWDRLDAMLSVAENENEIENTNKKKKPQRMLLYIAASFIAFLLVGVVLLNMQPEVNNTTITIDENAVVNNEENNISPTEGTNNSNVATSNVTENEVINESSISVQKQVVAAVNTKQSGVNGTKVTTGVKQPVNKINNSEVDNTTQSEQLLATVNESSLNKKENDDVAIGETTLKPNGITIDPNKLLASVEEDSKNKIEYASNKANTRIDSKELLSSVEQELDKSFRTKVLQSAVKQYNTIKSSVANRNYQ